MDFPRNLARPFSLRSPCACSLCVYDYEQLCIASDVEFTSANISAVACEAARAAVHTAFCDPRLTTPLALSPFRLPLACKQITWTRYNNGKADIQVHQKSSSFSLQNRRRCTVPVTRRSVAPLFLVVSGPGIIISTDNSSCNSGSFSFASLFRWIAAERNFGQGVTTCIASDFLINTVHQHITYCCSEIKLIYLAHIDLSLFPRTIALR
jgi:hypothetical protein